MQFLQKKTVHITGWLLISWAMIHDINSLSVIYVLCLIHMNKNQRKGMHFALDSEEDEL